MIDLSATQISAEFRELKQEFRDVISDITQKMGEGMCVFLSSPVETMEDWDEVRSCSVLNNSSCSVYLTTAVLSLCCWIGWYRTVSLVCCLSTRRR